MDLKQFDPSLDDFLMALRYEGIAVGSHEMVWLQHAFRLAPGLDRQDLQDLLACTLVKDPAHRQMFATLFEAWCPADAPEPVSPSMDSVDLPTPEEPGVSLPQGEELQPKNAAAELPETPPIPVPSLSPWRLALLVLLVLLSTVPGGDIAPHRMRDLPPSFQPSAGAGETVSSSPFDVTALPTDPAPQFWTWVPTFTIPSGNPLWPALAVALLALLGGAALGLRYQRRYTLPPAENPPGAGPDWLPLPTLPATGPELLDRQALRRTVWGIEGFVSEDTTSRIDVDRTVNSTARASGIPTIHFAPAVYPRELWLWRDTMVYDAMVERLCEELRSSLTRAGLPVRLGMFSNTPGLIRWDEGQEFSPLVLEGHRQSALVLLLTDGYGMRLAAQSSVEKGPLTQVLRAFGEWPRLAFVDVSAGANGLATFLQSYGLRCMAPEDIPAFLGAGAVQPMGKRRTETALLGELGMWAAATALAPEPVTPDSAFALRKHLQLTLAPGDIHHLMSAAGAGDRIVWSPTQRATLLNWLVQCSRTDQGEIGADSPLARALEYWLARYQCASAQRQTWQSRLLPWQHTPAEQRLRMEVALLELWRTPEKATKTLYGLRRCLQQELEERLALLDEWGKRRQQQDGVVYLPWTAAAQSAYVCWMLARLDFGKNKDRARKPLRRPVRLLLALGICAGLASMALGTILARLVAPDLPRIQPVLPSPLQAVMIQDMQRSGPGTYQLTIGTPRVLRTEIVPGHSELQVDWRWTAQENEQSLGQSKLWRAGTLPQAIRGCEAGWPRRSLIVIQAEPSDRAARQLAIQLLDRGSADAVLLGLDWATHLDRLIRSEVSMTRHDQLLLILPVGATVPAVTFQGAFGVVTAQELSSLLARLNFSGVRPVHEVWQEMTPPGRVLLRGGPQVSDKDPRTGMTFVQVCGGTFTMGSDGSDAYDDEKPAHPVTLSPFEISTTEVTGDQYRQWRQEYKGEAALPAVGVSWDDAKGFCENYGYALPTEAEWEYAARGGSVTRWSFGDTEELLENYAWFDKNSGSSVHPVGTKLPNPLGLYDMHGNVWEWVADCYDDTVYTKRSGLSVDPQVNDNCTSRVLRGGSAWFGPRDLRSSDRVRISPENRDVVNGFRCVRRPRRQP